MTMIKSAKRLTFAFCTYNRANRLESLITAMKAQVCPINFEILAVNNNSDDNTLEILEKLSTSSDIPIRIVTEYHQGIVPARNRAIEESISSDILVFIDDDEIPSPGLLQAATKSILEDRAECAGGRIKIDFSSYPRPNWLKDELLGFLAAIDYGDKSFWINSGDTPIWTSNIAYDMNIFRSDSQLRFDIRYNREGKAIGGGEDAIMFEELLKRKMRVRYCPEMSVLHAVEPWRLNRRYFLNLHFKSGFQAGLYELPIYPNNILGLPPFLITQLLKQTLKTFYMWLTNNPHKIRQGMNAAHALGSIFGYFYKNRRIKGK